VPLRDAVEDDIPGILSIYNDVIATSTAIYAEKAVALDDRLAWFRLRQQQGYPVLVATDDSGVTGFISFGDFRAWPCYLHSVEHSVHVRADRRRRGLGRSLIEALIPRASALGKHILIAGIDADNIGSLKLHQSLGFEQVAHLREVGRKFDRWLDLVLMQRFLDAPGAVPRREVQNTIAPIAEGPFDVHSPAA
jgi:phosphinothricin acetyltransferase